MSTFTFVAEDLEGLAVIHRQVNNVPASHHYLHVCGRTPEIVRYRTHRLLALLEATADLTLEDLRALARLKRNNNAYWKCILAFIQEASFAPAPPLVEIEAEDSF